MVSVAQIGICAANENLECARHDRWTHKKFNGKKIFLVVLSEWPVWHAD